MSTSKATFSESDVSKISDARRRVNELATMDENDFPKEKPFPAGQFTQACDSAGQALWRVLVLAHIHFGTRLPD